MSPDARNEQPGKPHGSGSDPLAEMSARDVEDAMAQAEGLAADAAEQVGAAQDEPGADQPSGRGERQADRQQANNSTDAPSESSAGEQPESDPVDEKLAQLEALLSGVRDDEPAPKPKQSARPAAKSKPPPASDEDEAESAEDAKSLSEQEAGQLDELIAGAVDAEAIEGAESGPSTRPQDSQPHVPPGETTDAPDTAIPAGQSELDDQPGSGESAPASPTLCTLTRALCATLEAIDRPFRQLSQQAKDIIGWVALGTLAVAVAVLILTFLIR